MSVVAKLTRRQCFISSYTIPNPFYQRLSFNRIFRLPANRLRIFRAEAHISPCTVRILYVDERARRETSRVYYCDSRFICACIFVCHTFGLHGRYGTTLMQFLRKDMSYRLHVYLPGARYIVPRVRTCSEEFAFRGCRECTIEYEEVKGR